MRFFRPLVRIVVAVENDFAVLVHNALDDCSYARVDVGRIFEFVGKLFELLRHNSVEHQVDACNRLRRARHTKFKLIARKRKRGSTVAVGGVHSEFRKHVYADFHFAFRAARIGASVRDCLQNACKFVSEEHTYDCGRRFVCAETVVV